jgi:hypothetical protein
MKRFLLGALAMGAFIVLTSFALSRTSPATTGPAWTVSQYQLDRAFRVQTFFGAGPSNSQMPSTQGLIITQLQRVSGDGVLTVTINGAAQQYNFLSQGQFGVPFGWDLNPPIIARPNDTLGFSLANSAGGLTLVMAGFTTLPGET